MEGHKDVWNVNVLAQYAGVAALGDGEYQDASRRLVAAEGIHLYEACKTWLALKYSGPASISSYGAWSRNTWPNP